MCTMRIALSMDTRATETHKYKQRADRNDSKEFSTTYGFICPLVVQCVQHCWYLSSLTRFRTLHGSRHCVKTGRADDGRMLWDTAWRKAGVAFEARTSSVTRCCDKPAAFGILSDCRIFYYPQSHNDVQSNGFDCVGSRPVR